ncbi:MAG: GNAT family N-acetyltransferase, partial [Gemmatimonadales bacterium]|nr:GNAT family N-acetyltransferase [Gemmatimonadales bacterium]
MRIYEYDPQEIGELLPFRNAMFEQVSEDHWRAMNCTGVVAREGDQLVGFIPLQYREQRLNARVTIPVAYENAVGVTEGKRGQGIGTWMIDKAARFMSDRVDALMVVREGEQSEG